MERDPALDDGSVPEPRCGGAREPHPPRRLLGGQPCLRSRSLPRCRCVGGSPPPTALASPVASAPAQLHGRLPTRISSRVATYRATQAELADAASQPGNGGGRRYGRSRRPLPACVLRSTSSRNRTSWGRCLAMTSQDGSTAAVRARSAGRSRRRERVPRSAGVVRWRRRLRRLDR